MQDLSVFGRKIFSQAIILGLNLTLHMHTLVYKYGKYPPGPKRAWYGIVHSLSSGKVATTPILKSVPSQFSPFIRTLTRQFSPKVAHKNGDKEKITAIYCLWMVNNKRGENGSEQIKM